MSLLAHINQRDVKFKFLECHFGGFKGFLTKKDLKFHPYKTMVVQKLLPTQTIFNGFSLANLHNGS